MPGEHMFFVMIVLAIFFAVNMGGASFAASFAAAVGGKTVDRKRAAFLFLTFVVLGAVVNGQAVTATLGQKIVPAEMLSYQVILIIFLSAGLSMLVANMMNIPQSTSLVTVGSIAGVGLYYQKLNVGTVLYLIPFWIFLPVISYGLTYLLARGVYPPRKSNFWFYEKFANHRNRLKIFVIFVSCYNAFSVGTNNVANVVGPMLGTSTGYLLEALFVFGVVYGIGAWIFSGPLRTTGTRIVPLGLLTASIISLVSGSLMILASSFGVPQSFVMLQVAAVFAIGTLKHGQSTTFAEPLAKRTLFTWTINPILTLGLSYVLAAMILR